MFSEWNAVCFRIFLRITVFQSVDDQLRTVPERGVVDERDVSRYLDTAKVDTAFKCTFSDLLDLLSDHDRRQARAVTESVLIDDLEFFA